MRKLILILILFLLATTNVNAQNIESQIDDLKERIASRVAQLKLVEKRGIMGKVESVSPTQIRLTDVKGETRLVDVDELTKFEGDEDSFGISDIEKGDNLGVLGLYNKQSRRVLARVVSLISVPKYVTGVVESVDEENFSFDLALKDNKVITVDVETTTRSSSYTKEDGLVKAGFSKITVGQNVIVNGAPDENDKERITGSKIIIFPELPKNPRISIDTNDVKVVPSTGSGKKLTPLTP